MSYCIIIIIGSIFHYKVLHNENIMAWFRYENITNTYLLDYFQVACMSFFCMRKKVIIYLSSIIHSYSFFLLIVFSFPFRFTVLVKHQQWIRWTVSNSNKTVEWLCNFFLKQPWDFVFVHGKVTSRISSNILIMFRSNAMYRERLDLKTNVW